MEDSNGRVELAATLKALREEVRGLVTDEVIVERANAILDEAARLRHVRNAKAARDRGVKPPPFPEPEKVASRKAFNSWTNAHPKLPPTEAQLLAVVAAIHRARNSRVDAQLSSGDIQYWRQLYRAAASTPSRTLDRNPVPGSDNASEPKPLGRLLSEVGNPFELEVHEPITVTGAGRLSVLPPYVRRGHDEDLTAVVERALAGHSGVAVLLGDSSTGKTRALWEALALLREHDGWRLWHPSPARQELSEQLERVGPRTVVWLNETQRYFLPASGSERERLAEDLRKLIGDTGRGPVLIVGTLWHIHYNTLCADPGSATRKLLGPIVIPVPPKFTGDDLDAMRAAAKGDARLELACGRAEGGQITQYLAGGPELHHVYDTAGEIEKAVIEAAMDAVRLGHPNVLGFTLLREAAAAYVSDATWDCLPENWFETALAEASRSCKGARGPVTPVRSRLASVRGRDRRSRVDAGSGEPVYQLADYLDQHGRRTRTDDVPPTGFWEAVAAHAGADQQYTFAGAAWDRGLYRDAAQLWKNATSRGDVRAARHLLTRVHPLFPQDPRPAAWVAAHASLDDADGVSWLLEYLQKAGANEQTQVLLSRAPAAQACLDAPDGAAYLLRALRMAGAEQQVRVLLARDPAARVALDIPYGVPTLLNELREAGADEQMHALAERAAAHSPLEDASLVAALLKGLREAGAEEQVHALLARDPATHIPFEDLYDVGYLLEGLREAGAEQQVQILLARDPFTHTSFSPDDHGFLLDKLREAGAEQQVRALLARDPAGHACLGNPGDVAFLLSTLWEVRAEEQVRVLLARDPAAHACLDNAPGTGFLLSALWMTGAEQQVRVLLARDPIARVPLDDPDSVASLLESLREVGAEKQVQALLGRDPAAHARLDNPRGVASLLEVLQRAGADEQVQALLGRDPAAHARLDNPRELAFLVESLQVAGADEQVTEVFMRLPAAGMFDQFIGVSPDRQVLRFGWEPHERVPAEPWSWDDLD